MTPPPGTQSAHNVEHLMRILRRYADSRVGLKLAEALADLADGEAAGLVAFEEGSDERIVESVLAGIHQKLAVIVGDLFDEIADTRLDARDWLDDLSPDDFGGESS